MNELAKNYTVRKLKKLPLLKEEHVKIYIVLEKDRYIATVKVNLISEEPFTLIDFTDTKVQGKDGRCYYEAHLALEAVSNYVLKSIWYKA